MRRFVLFGVLVLSIQESHATSTLRPLTAVPNTTSLLAAAYGYGTDGGQKSALTVIMPQVGRL